MSLHLIESHQLRPATVRKPGGAISSMFIHAALVTAVFTIASTTPLSRSSTHDAVHVVFVPPPLQPPSVNRAPSEAGNSAAALNAAPIPPERTIPNMDLEISAAIPAINANTAAMDEPITVGGVHASGNQRNGLGSGAASAILDAPQVDKPVVALAGFPAPRYPEAMRMAGVQENVLATFVVDTLGRVEPASVSFPPNTHNAFASAVREALASARYRAAEANGHLVRQRVAQPFVFSLRN
ncbi:MAG: energy transducer TonB [Gemmatimonadota bacterium]|nr:energy transducer TonB [Gemmatimonadota bacterium]